MAAKNDESRTAQTTSTTNTTTNVTETLSDSFNKTLNYVTNVTQAPQGISTGWALAAAVGGSVILLFVVALARR